MPRARKNKIPRDRRGRRLYNCLTSHEQAVIGLLLKRPEGLTDAAISAALGLSSRQAYQVFRELADETRCAPLGAVALESRETDAGRLYRLTEHWRSTHRTRANEPA